MFHDRLDPVSQTSVKLPHMNALQGAIKTRFPVSGQFIGKVLVTCPNCGRAISSRQNWNTWKVTCKSCETILLASIFIRVPSKHALKRKYVRPADTVMPRTAVLPWKSGEPANLVEVEDGKRTASRRPISRSVSP